MTARETVGLANLAAAVRGGLWSLRLLPRFGPSLQIPLGSPPEWVPFSECLPTAAKEARVGFQNDGGTPFPPPKPTYRVVL